MPRRAPGRGKGQTKPPNLHQQIALRIDTEDFASPFEDLLHLTSHLKSNRLGHLLRVPLAASATGHELDAYIRQL